MNTRFSDNVLLRKLAKFYCLAIKMNDLNRDEAIVNILEDEAILMGWTLIFNDLSILETINFLF